MGFWDRFKKDKKDKSSKQDRDDERDVQILVEQERLAEIQRKKDEADQKRQAEKLAKNNREAQALAEQKRQSEANQKASEARTVINPYTQTATNRNIASQQNKLTNVQVSAVNTASVVSRSLPVSLTKNTEQEKKTEALIEYVDPKTGKIVILKSGQTPPSGYIQRGATTVSVGINNSTTAIQRAKANADAIIYGKQALQSSQLPNNFYTNELAESAKTAGVSVDSENKSVNLSLPDVSQFQPGVVSSEPTVSLNSSDSLQLNSLSLEPVALKTSALNVAAPQSLSADSISTEKIPTVDIENTLNVATPKQALAPSSTGLDWRNAAGTGTLANSAAKVELSNVINTSNLTAEDKATFAKEQIWKNMSEQEKILARQTLPDKDGDMVPDIYDCVPDDYTKQGYADIYLGGKYAMQKSTKSKRVIVSGKGKLQMAQSMNTNKDVLGAVASEAQVGAILNLTSDGSTAGSNPALSGGDVSSIIGDTKKVSSKITGGNLKQSVTLKSKQNDNFKVNLNKNFNKTYSVNALNKKKFGSKTASKKNLNKTSANKEFKKISKRFGL
jgi:hypothetical protein